MLCSASAIPESLRFERKSPGCPRLFSNLTRPVPTKDRGVLRTVADARDYMLALPEDREFKHHWQHTAKMILDQADVADVSRRVELALFYDSKLDLVALYG